MLSRIMMRYLSTSALSSVKTFRIPIIRWCPHNLKLYSPKQLEAICAFQVNITPVRMYAKSRDKKKEKVKGKVSINVEQLSEVVDVGNLNTQMQKCMEHLKDDFIKNLSLRSTTGAIETLTVIVDGKDYELQELAQIARKNPKTIVINMVAFPQAIPMALDAIQKSGMNLNPQQDGTTLFIPVPKVTKEHRENLAKNAKTLFIKCRDSIRDVQNVTIKKVKRQENLASDLAHSVHLQVVSIGDQYVLQAEKMLESKQDELIGKD